MAISCIHPRRHRGIAAFPAARAAGRKTAAGHAFGGVWHDAGDRAQRVAVLVGLEARERLDEGFGIRMQGMLQDIGGASCLDDVPRIHDRDLIADL